ncbi:Glutamyl endopeptidase precursor [Microbacterium azadirachtae]|uniref:Serine protease n=1 Tax=Microbacterium azadirachtae TaxID=582680 RepID=A0A0F0KEW8_9MICO|nr:trypsin-like peptidase domain-containing protein [Microbacterium azadirachtae]KJL18964.1 Glutamyl endopeptidase precursor [Microbacterium azadirachtae]
MATRGKGPDGAGASPDPLEFRGSREAPDELQRIVERPPLIGDASAMPAQARDAVTRRRIWLPGSARTRPKVSVERDDDGWEIAYEATDVHRIGRTAERIPPDEVLRGIDPRVGPHSHRPGWVTASYYPRPAIAADGPSVLHRFDGGTTQPLWVFGPDDRAVYRDATWPWGLVGKVFNSDGKVGTGALIGDRLVATAGHMVPWGKKGWWMRFVPAYFDGSSLHGSGFESYVSDARGYDVHGDVTGYDWAVLRLYQPLGSWLGYFGYNGFSSSWQNQNRWTLLGYPGAVAGGQRPSRQFGSSVFDIDSDSHGGSELETRADMTPGNSGGPYFGWFDGDPRLVGVVSGQETEWAPGPWPWEWGDTEKVNVVAGGSGFTGMMAWGRSNWPL